jgi:ribosomal protein S27AE
MYDQHDDEFKDELDDEDWYDDDADDAAGDAAMPCPECGADIYDDLDHCPRCGYWITEADDRATDRGHFPSRHVRLVALVVLVAFVILLLGGTIGLF